MTDTAPAGIDLFDVEQLLLAEAAEPPISAQHAEARDHVWNKAVQSNPSLFDGPVVACGGLELTEPGVLLLSWVRVSYRHYALRRVPGAIALPSLFTNVVQPTIDGRVVAARMSASTAAPGRWQLPGGSVEPPKDGAALDQPALAEQAARELFEELGINTAAGKLRLWAVTRGENGSVGLTYLAPALPEAELRARFAARDSAARWLVERSKEVITRDRNGEAVVLTGVAAAREMEERHRREVKIAAERQAFVAELQLALRHDHVGDLRILVRFISQLTASVPAGEEEVELLRGARERLASGHKLGVLQTQVARRRWIQRTCPACGAAAGKECFDETPARGPRLRRVGGHDERLLLVVASRKKAEERRRAQHVESTTAPGRTT